MNSISSVSRISNNNYLNMNNKGCDKRVATQQQYHNVNFKMSTTQNKGCLAILMTLLTGFFCTKKSGKTENHVESKIEKQKREKYEALKETWKDKLGKEEVDEYGTKTKIVDCDGEIDIHVWPGAKSLLGRAGIHHYMGGIEDNKVWLDGPNGCFGQVPISALESIAEQIVEGMDKAEVVKSPELWTHVEGVDNNAYHIPQ